MRVLGWTFSILLLYLFRDSYGSKQMNLKRKNRFGCVNIFKTVFPCLCSENDEDDKSEKENSALLGRGPEYGSFPKSSNSNSLIGPAVKLGRHRQTGEKRVTIEYEHSDLPDNQNVHQINSPDSELNEDPEDVFVGSDEINSRCSCLVA